MPQGTHIKFPYTIIIIDTQKISFDVTGLELAFVATPGPPLLTIEAADPRRLQTKAADLTNFFMYLL